MVAVGPATDLDVGTADGELPGVADFDPTPAGRDRDEVTAVAPDGADFEPTSLDSASARGSDATAAMPIGIERVVDGVSDRGYGTGAFADEVYLLMWLTLIRARPGTMVMRSQHRH